MYHNVDVPQDLRYILTLTREDHAVIEPQLPGEHLYFGSVVSFRGAGADHKKPDVPTAPQNDAGCPQIKVDSLPRHQSSNTRADRCSSRNAEFSTQRTRPGRPLRTRRQNDAVTNDLDLLLLHTLFNQPIPPRAAVSQHAIG